jgi:hypothetical protein
MGTAIAEPLFFVARCASRGRSHHGPLGDAWLFNIAHIREHCMTVFTRLRRHQTVLGSSHQTNPASRAAVLCGLVAGAALPPWETGAQPAKRRSAERNRRNDFGIHKLKERRVFHPFVFPARCIRLPLSPTFDGAFFRPLFCFAQTPSGTSCLSAPRWRGLPRNAMLTSAECRQRAEQKMAEAELHPRRRKKLRSDAKSWLILADLMAGLEANLQVTERAK